MLMVACIWGSEQIVCKFLSGKNWLDKQKCLNFFNLAI